jgi:tetratricopeptide (TPR) repeat protein
METKNQQAEKNSKQKLACGISVKLILVMLSFIQAHWVSIACAAGTVAAATMFGDKSYVTNLAKKSKTMLKEGKTEDAIKLLESEISGYLAWRQNNILEAQARTDQDMPDMYFYLAKAKEAAGLDKNEVVDAYKRAVASLSYSGEAFAWLYKNDPNMKQQSVIEQILKDAPEGRRGFYVIVQQLEKADDWNAFESFLGTVFEQTPVAVSTAKAIETCLEEGGKWNDKFIKYCSGKPRLVEFAYAKDCKIAEELVKKEDFKKAAAVYKDMAVRYETLAEQKVDIEFKICQCLFNADDYNVTLSELNSFIERNKTKNRKLCKDAFLLKGQCYIQLGELDKAANEFTTLMIEYPEAKESPEASFFVGYCYMLQNKFDQAKEALNLVVKDYPQSSFASKAKLCLTRIESMTK